MAAFSGIFLVLVFGFSTGVLGEPLRMIENFTISSYFPERSLFDNMGIVSGVRNCGGSGKFIRYRFEHCNTGQQPPCTLFGNAVGRSELLFVPSDNEQGVIIRSKISINAVGKSFENVLDAVHLVAGQPYTLNFAGDVPSQLKGQLYTAQLEIDAMDNGQHLVCAQVDYFVY